MLKLVVVLLVLGGIWQYYNSPSKVVLGPGVTVPDSPVQIDLDESILFKIDEYNAREIAKFDIRAKVLSRKDYILGSGANLSPTDLALGWGNMSDESILEKIEITQRNRFYFWRVEKLPIPKREIEIHSANMHLVPANEHVKSVIKQVRKGDIIQISGALVNIYSNDGEWYWKTSLSRNDTGGGACEIIYVKDIFILTESI